MIFSEAWWMETIIAALITSGLTLLGTVIAGVLGFKYKLKDLLEGQQRLSEGQGKLSGEHGKLSEEHGELSEEHKKLSMEHMQLSHEQKTIQKDLSDVRPKVERILEDTRKMSLIQDRQEQAEKHMPAEAELLRMVREVYQNQALEISKIQEFYQRESEKVTAELKQLKEENQKLHLQIERQRQELQEYQQRESLFFGHNEERNPDGEREL